MEWKDIPKYHIIEIIQERYEKGTFYVIKLPEDRYREIEYLYFGNEETFREYRDLDDMWVGRWSSLEDDFTIVADHGYLDEAIFQFIERLEGDN